VILMGCRHGWTVIWENRSASRSRKHAIAYSSIAHYPTPSIIDSNPQGLGHAPFVNETFDHHSQHRHIGWEP